MLGADGASDTFELAHRSVGVHTDDEEIAEFFGKREVAHMANVQNIEAAVGRDDFQALRFCLFHKRLHLRKRHDATFRSRHFCGTLRTIMARTNTFASAFLRHSDVIEASMRQILPDVERGAILLVAALKRGHKVLVCGNGGSAADSQHFAAELVGRYKGERKALPAIALTTDTSALTSIGNDYGFEAIFSRQVEALGTKGDVLVAITTSGASKNVLAALAAARKKKMHVVVLTGAKGSALRRKVDVAVVVPSKETARIQEIHEIVYHTWCEYIDSVVSKA